MKAHPVPSGKVAGQSLFQLDRVFNFINAVLQSGVFTRVQIFLAAVICAI